LAQKSVITVDAWKIVTPQGNISFNGGSTTAGTTKKVTLMMWGTSAIIYSIPARTGSTSTDDSLLVTSDGFNLYITQESADVATGLSATDLSGS